MLQAGQTVGQFKIIQQLGVGGLGVVFLAEDQKLGRKVALKVLLPEFFDNVERLERFNREARTAAQITHPNVMGIYDIGEAVDPESGKQLQFIVMEYIDGKSLSKFIQSSNPDMKELVRLGEKIADGIAAAHRLNIVHRDIKSDNVLVDNDGQPKVLDFGLAKPLDTVQFEGDSDSTNTVSQELTKAGKIMGTVSYMSPEQARGESVDTRSDIFSFGILLYRMVTGVFPFAGETQVSTLAKILEVKHDSPRIKNDQVPSELERIIDKCLQKDPADRYQDARDLVVDLRSLRRQFDSGISDTISSISDSPKRRKTGFNRLVYAGAAVVLIVLLAFIWPGFKSGFVDGLGGGRVQATENNLAILGFSNKTGDSSLDWLETGLPEILLTDLAQNGNIGLIGQERLIDHIGRDQSGEVPFDRLIKAARDLGAAKVLSGSYFKLGNQIRIDARLEDIKSGQIIFAEKVMGEDPFSLVDSLTSKLAVSLDMVDIMRSNASVSQYTSSSPEAYKLYLQGMDQFLTDQYEEAIASFEGALKIDSTFAMAYLRIGMVYTFQGRQQQGQPYFSRADEFQHRLPERDRKLLDIYLDIWKREQFGQAFTKMEKFVQQFPDDKEGRSIMGLLYGQLASDSTRGFAQLDTALQLDKNFLLAQGFYVQLLRQYGQLDRAVEMSELIARNNPGSPIANSTLAGLYERVGRVPEAEQIYREMIEKSQDVKSALNRMYYLYLDREQFDSARVYAERFKERFGDDPFHLASYYQMMANLANWKGKFRDGLDYRHDVLEAATQGGDTSQIRGAYESLSTYFERYNQYDSALYFAKRGFKYNSAFQRLNFPILVVQVDSSQADFARPIMQEAIQDSKSIVPKQMWSLLDAVYDMFEGYATSDTLRLLAGLKVLAESVQSGEGGGNNLEYGEVLIMSGQYEAGLEQIQMVIGQTNRPSNAWYYNYAHYLAGRAYEGMGKTREAIENYEEMLRHWGNPQLEIKEIVDARKRLAALRG